MSNAKSNDELRQESFDQSELVLVDTPYTREQVIAAIEESHKGHYESLREILEGPDPLSN